MHRSIWSVGFFIIGVIWPLTWPIALRQENTAAALVWGVSCAVTAVFPLLPVNLAESLIMMYVIWGAGQRWFVLMTFLCSEMGGVVMLVVGRVCMPYVVRSVEKRNGTKDAEELKKRLRVQVSITTFSMVVVNKMLSADGIDNYGHDHDCEFGSESSSKARAAVA